MQIIANRLFSGKKNGVDSKFEACIGVIEIKRKGSMVKIRSKIPYNSDYME
jgi:hypothetical protein